MSPAAIPLTIHELVSAHFDVVWRWLRAFGVHRDDADDAAQQVFLVASRKQGDIVAGSERSFLFGTARGVAANYRRISRRRAPIADEAEVVALLDSAPNAEEMLADRQAHAVLEHLIARLDDDLRDVFVLFQLEELPAVEIAAILAIPPGTVASRSAARARSSTKPCCACERRAPVPTEASADDGRYRNRQGRRGRPRAQARCLVEDGRRVACGQGGDARALRGRGGGCREHGGRWGGPRRERRPAGWLRRRFLRGRWRRRWGSG